MNGFFGNLFDFNEDGNLDSLELGLDFIAFDRLMEDEKLELEIQRLDSTELETMDADERYEALEDARLDTDDNNF